MIKPKLLADVRVAYCHKNPDSPCPDGVASALLVHAALERVDIAFVDHTQLALLRPHPGALFCDIAPPPDNTSWAHAGALVLDHHKTAEPVVRAFESQGYGAFGDEATEPGVSGAVLAYRHVFVPLRGEHLVAKHFALLAGVRDTWQRHDPTWTAACAQAEALRFWPWASYPDRPFTVDSGVFVEMLEVGHVLLQKQAEQTRALIRQGYCLTTAQGTRLFIIPTRETSDVAEALGPEADLVVGFGYRAHGGEAPPELSLSTRSHTGYDCAALAAHYGGGGHKAAAGFRHPCRLTDPQPYALIRDLVERFEARHVNPG